MLKWLRKLVKKAERLDGKKTKKMRWPSWLEGYELEKEHRIRDIKKAVKKIKKAKRSGSKKEG